MPYPCVRPPPSVRRDPLLVENPSAPPGRSDKYARRERERRFLLRHVPVAPPTTRVVAITDHYLRETRLRLRCTVERGGANSKVFKLTQKISGPDRRPGLITTMYLSEEEYDLLRGLPAESVDKVRYSVAPLGVDQFGDRLRGLVLAEAEFDSDEEMAAFRPPAWVLAEVTADERFTGGRLAHTTRKELIKILSEFCVEVTDEPGD